MKDNQPNLNLSRVFRTSYPDIMDNGLAADILLNEFFGSVDPMIFGQIKINGSFVNIISRKYKTGGVFVDAVSARTKIGGVFV